MEGETEIEPLVNPVDPMKAHDPSDRPIYIRSATGGWTAALYIMGAEIAERSAYCGVSLNLINYLTGPLGESTAAAAVAVNVWSGVSYMLPLVGAFVADSYLGRYRTIVLASLLYLLGLGLLTLSVLPTINPSECNDAKDLAACSLPQFQAIVFYFSLYLVAFAQGGYSQCIQALGADQFDENSPEECKARSSFFNWWNFGVFVASLVTNLPLNYIQDNISWTLGFGIPWIFMAGGLTIFLLGNRFYRCHLIEGKNPLTDTWKACVALISNWQRTSFATSKNGAGEVLLPRASQRTRHCGYSQHESIDEAGQEEAKGLLQLFPIGATCLTSAAIFSQATTLFTKQASTLDRRIGTGFQVPPASLGSFIVISIIVFIPIYDRVIVPIARNFTGLVTGITMLQRIGTGISLSVIMMVVAALVEMKRLKTARDFGLVDMPNVPIPMSMWWLLPSYLLNGIAVVFFFIGLQEFFYDQVPDEMRSLGLALHASIVGAGELLSGFLVSVIDKVTRSRGESWFSNNLNHAHLDYFYWLLAGLNLIQLGLYLCIAQSYVYKKKVPIAR